MKIRIPEVKEIVKTAYRCGDRMPVLILGSTGIGKSEAVRQIGEELAGEMGKEFVFYDDNLAEQLMAEPDRYFVLVDRRLTSYEPVDFSGVIREINGHCKYKPMLWSVVLSKCAGILFLDEITNVYRADMKSEMFKILLDRQIGEVKLSDNVMIVCAGNKPEHSSIASMLPVPVIARMSVIEAEKATIDEWATYMDTYYKDWDRRVLAFLKAYSNFFDMAPTDGETLDVFPVPRKWTSVATLLTKYDNIDSAEQMIISKVGVEAGTHFAIFIKIDVPKPDDILANPKIWSSLNDEAKYLETVMLSNIMVECIEKNALSKMDNFIAYLIDNDREFVSVLLAMLPKNYIPKLVVACTMNKKWNAIMKFVNRLAGYLK